ncbi:MAG TPA: ABC transporter ATP-binding protein [Candidatus Limnocylindria bacterium]|nr:ABC transporter ATP-binding protein [Candidatus Limnocylindria bacterium]
MTTSDTAAAAEPAIVVRGLRKSYGSFEAVRGIDFEVARGEVFALLGPNGAGKTTTVEILEGHRQRTGGEVSVLGFDPGRSERALKERIGIVLQQTGVDEYLTVREVVEMVGGYYPSPRPVDEVIELVGLTDQANERIRKLSGGQKRRVDLAVALAGDPELLFLDEPTTGFDPSARRQAWETVRGLTLLGKTILLATHFMDEAQVLANRLAIMSRGRIIATGTPGELIGAASDTTLIRFRLPDGLRPPDRLGLRREGAVWVLESTVLTRDLHELSGWAMAEDVELADLEVTRRSLEDVYLQLTAESGEEAS